MRAFLSILGIVCAAVAALVAVALSGSALPYLVLALLVLTGIVAILSRGANALPVGIALCVLGVLALLYFNPIEGKQTYLPDLPAFFAEPWLGVLLLAGAAGVLWVSRAAWGAAWVGYGGLAACGLAALLVLLTDAGSFGSMAGLNWATALLALAAAVACGLLLREPVPDAAPAATGTTTTARHR